MLRTSYARVSGIMIYNCGDHGTWADHDQALRLIELFQDGGDDRLRQIAMQRERDDLSRSMERVQNAQAALSAQVGALDIRSRVHLFLDWFGFL